MSKIRSALSVGVGGCAVFTAYQVASGNEKFYSKVVMPTFRLLDAETSHVASIKLAKYGIVPWNRYKDPPSLNTSLLGLKFPNPVGLAAGYDKHAEAADAMLGLGFGFVEVGSVTPLPQVGQTKPRLFRLVQDRAVINRYGFNSHGHDVVYSRLYKRKGVGILGVNLGKNKETADSAGDFLEGVRRLGPVADFLVINISSPNTPGLRDMQGSAQLTQLINKVLEERDKIKKSPKPPILVKIAPDLTTKDKEDIAAVLTSKQVDGLIVSNTTVSRPAGLKSPNKEEKGGLSGAPLKQMSTQCIRDMYTLTQGQIPIIGVGGVGSGQDAYDKIKAGASLVEVYTALAYEGPPLVTKIKRELSELISNDGFSSVSEAIGLDHR